MDREVFALISRIHVIMRHAENKTVDIARLQTDANYAREILTACTQSSNAELVRLGIKLNDALFGENGHFTQMAKNPATETTLRGGGDAATAPAPTSGSDSDGTISPEDAKRYIRSLR